MRPGEDEAEHGVTSPPLEEGGEGARSGACAIVGRPNVGKSTLLNALLGQKLAIASERPGTTRVRLLGLFTQAAPPTQIAFVDTPGLARPRSALGHVLDEEVAAGVRDADVVLLVAQAGRRREPALPDDERALLERIAEGGRPAVLALNKVDLVGDKRRLLPWLEAYGAAYPFRALVPVSARSGDGLGALVAALRGSLPEGLSFDPALLTDRPERFFAAELVREAVLRHVRAEVPYGVAVTIDRWEDDGGLTRIHATIVVEKASHKGILIGARGERLKRIGTEARLGIEAMIERRVHLELWVRVDEGWTRDAVKARRHVHEAAP